MRFCPNCNSAVYDDRAELCPECGKPMNQNVCPSCGRRGYSLARNVPTAATAAPTANAIPCETKVPNRLSAAD